jgi:hypothetical protein
MPEIERGKTMYAARKRHDWVELANHAPGEREAPWPRLVQDGRAEGRGPWPRLVREVAEALRDLPEDSRAVLRDSRDEPHDREDELFLLGERCAEAYMQAEALHGRAMELLAEFHRREGWRDTGFGSTAEWLAWRIGIKPGAARERVRTALALERLPETSRAMKNGELSFTKVRALTVVGSQTGELG